MRRWASPAPRIVESVARPLAVVLADDGDKRRRCRSCCSDRNVETINHNKGEIRKRRGEHANNCVPAAESRTRESKRKQHKSVRQSRGTGWRSDPILCPSRSAGRVADHSGVGRRGPGGRTDRPTDRVGDASIRPPIPSRMMSPNEWTARPSNKVSRPIRPGLITFQTDV
jgi:hypothetical protein